MGPLLAGRDRGDARAPAHASFAARDVKLRKRTRPAAAGSSAVVMLDADGRITAVNHAWRKTVAAHGFVLPKAGIGSCYVDAACRLLPDLDRAALELSLQRLLSGETESLRHNCAPPTAHGCGSHVQITLLSGGTAGQFVAVHDDLTELALAQEALQLTAQQLLTARDEERQRIALELHDSTSQHLVAIKLSLARLRRLPLDGALVGGVIDDMATSLAEAVKETRVLSYLMNPHGLAQNGLEATLRQFLKGFATRAELEVSLKADAAVDDVPAPLQHAALRIVQEALLNAHRHAQADRVSIELAVEDDQLTVSVADDGRGMSMHEGEPTLGVGVPGMRARAQQFSGRLAISSDGSGTRIVAVLPLG
jgi:signal transduction histidine kinase